MDKPWLERARRDTGLRETGANPRILAMFANTTIRTGTDSTPWCAAAMCTWLEESGVRSPRSAWARDFLKWGEKVDNPEKGDIVVFSRNGVGGHVGNFLGFAPNGKIRTFGGNQSDSVCEAEYPVELLLGFRRPKPSDYKIPAASPVMEPPPSVAIPRMVEDELRTEGSRTIENADQLQRVGTGMAVVTTFLALLRQMLDAMKPLLDHAWILFIVLGIVVIYYARTVKAARVDDAMSGRHIGVPREDIDEPVPKNS